MLPARLFIASVFFAFIALLMSCSQNTMPFQEQISAFQEADQQNPSPEGVVLFTGSSSVRMWKSLQQDFPDRQVLNRGFGGSSMADLLARFDEVIAPHNPSAIFIYEGDNDLAQGQSEAEIMANTRKVLARIRKKDKAVPVVFISPKPSVARKELRDRYISFNKVLSAWTNTREHVHYLDVWEPMMAEDGRVREDIFIEDNLHMNAKGYAIWKQAVGDMLEDLDNGML